MSNKKLKIFLLAIFSLVLGIICISVFSSKNNEALYLSKNVNKFKLITHSNEKFDDKLFSNYPSLIFFGFLNCPDVCPFDLLKISKNKFFSNPAYYFIYTIRGTPLLLQLFFIYYGLAQFTFIRESFLWYVLESPLFCGILTLTLSTAAYSAEIIRGGMQSVSSGYIEAGSSMGMSKMLRLS